MTSRTADDDLKGALQTSILATLREIEAYLGKQDLSAREVHLARRAAKRARALARLTPTSPDDLARRTKEAVRVARRALGHARDAEVRRATLERLRDRLGAAHAPLASAIGADAAHAPVDHSAARTELVALITEWTNAGADGGRNEIEAAATAAYRKARKRARHAASGGTVDLHHWRTAVVDLEYQAGFLADAAPAMAKQSKRADELRRRLGDLLDLDALAAFVRTHADDALRAASGSLDEAAAKRRAKLLAKAQRLGAKMFDKKPKKWLRRLRRSSAR